MFWQKKRSFQSFWLILGDAKGLVPIVPKEGA